MWNRSESFDIIGKRISLDDEELKRLENLRVYTFNGITDDIITVDISAKYFLKESKTRKGIFTRLENNVISLDHLGCDETAWLFVEQSTIPFIGSSHVQNMPIEEKFLAFGEDKAIDILLQVWRIALFHEIDAIKSLCESCFAIFQEEIPKQQLHSSIRKISWRRLTLHGSSWMDEKFDRKLGLILGTDVATEDAPALPLIFAAEKKKEISEKKEENIENEAKPGNRSATNEDLKKEEEEKDDDEEIKKGKKFLGRYRGYRSNKRKRDE